ncbi:hypothetical protein EWM64_g8798 [Hericium alpestre]|uniref:Uncharacterized protein n=1 Tax=Hericium alpestre TaxID=135208 RepID=A0A4Y9ZKE8_9AGAM|nr:hypothetical protein EWM64_g8798 [Hericium alpestre]
MPEHIRMQHPEFASPGHPVGRPLPEDLWKDMKINLDEEQFLGIPQEQIPPPFENVAWTAVEMEAAHHLLTMSDDGNVNISITHDDSVDISQVLLLPKTPIIKPVMFHLIRKNTKGAELNKHDKGHVSEDLGVGAQREISEPVASDLAAAPAATALSDTQGVEEDGETPAPITPGLTITPVASGSAAAVKPAAPPSDTEGFYLIEETPPPVTQQLKALPKLKIKTYPEIFSWDDPSHDFYVGTQPQEYPPTSCIRSLFKDKGKCKAEPAVYIKSEEDDTKRVRLFD